MFLENKKFKNPIPINEFIENLIYHNIDSKDIKDCENLKIRSLELVLNVNDCMIYVYENEYYQHGIITKEGLEEFSSIAIYRSIYEGESYYKSKNIVAISGHEEVFVASITNCGVEILRFYTR